MTPAHKNRREPLSVGILAVGDAKDGPAQSLKKAVEKLGWNVEVAGSVPDDARQIRASLVDLCVENRVQLVLTVGGTGLRPGDVTPEASRQVFDREFPGITDYMRADCCRRTPLAALSRGTAGMRRKTLIVNLPGSPKGVLESFRALAKVVPHAVRMLNGCC